MPMIKTKKPRYLIVISVTIPEILMLELSEIILFGRKTPIKKNNSPYIVLKIAVYRAFTIGNFSTFILYHSP